MKTLSSTLLSAQRNSNHVPYVKIEVKNKMTGLNRLVWERLYQGTEDERHHGMAFASDGSLIRVRISPPGDGLKLYRQRMANPGPESDFSTWTYTNQYDCLAVAVATYGAEVSIFWLNGSYELQRIKSTDYGITWSSPQWLDSSQSTDIGGMTAAYKPNGDLAIFFTDQMTLYVKKCVAGNWSGKSAWDKTTGYLSGVAAVYDGDWDLLVTGQDTEDNHKVWSLVYGDGQDVPSGSWSALKELASAPAGGDFEYCGVFLDKQDVHRAFYVEKFTGVQGYTRPFWTHLVPETSFIDNLWREPVPFNLMSEYGIAIAHSGNYAWLSTPGGVWRSILPGADLDVSSDVTSIDCELSPGKGHLVVNLRNDDGRYQSPGEGNLATLKIGNQVEFSPGYVTSQGNETSPGLTFWLETWEHNSSAGKSSLTLYCKEDWNLLENWRARHQFRWNKISEEMSVKQILEFVLARVGLKLEVKSQSDIVAGFFPDFTIHPNDTGDAIISKLLSFVSDVIFIEGVKVYLANPQSTDASEYSYGQNHSIFQGKYGYRALQTNQVRVEGYDPDNDEPIVAGVFDWSQLESFYDRVTQIVDRNLNTLAECQASGNTLLRKAEIASTNGLIRVPANCGQQLFDVIDITDSRAGLDEEKRRILSIVLSYHPERAEYEQKLLLCGV